MAKIGSEFQVNTYTASDQYLPSVATLSNGNFVVTWTSDGQDGSSWGVYAQIFTNDGVKSGSEFQVNTYTASDQQAPFIATLSNGNFVVTWTSYLQDGSSWGVYGQIFTNAGVKSGSEFQVNTYTASDQQAPFIATLSNGNFVVTWTSYLQDGSDAGVYAQIFTNDGVKSGSEFQVHTYTANHQFSPSIATLSNGNFVVTWHSDGQDGSSWGVYAQIFTNDGVKSGSEFQVNTYTASHQFASSIATLSNNNFVVTWTSDGQDGSSWGVYAQIFTNDGVKSGSEFQVNTYTASDQYLPSVATLSNGNFVVTWTSYLQDGSDAGVYAQIFTNSGVKSGSEFQVNTYTASGQYDPSVATLSNGNFVVTWYSDGQDGSGWGVYGQMFGDTSTTSTSTSTTTKSTTLTPTTTPTSTSTTTTNSTPTTSTTSTTPTSTTPTTSVPTIAPTLCLKLKTLTLGSIGDLDRKNEEIELEIKSLNKQLDCGLFLFDIAKNVKDKNLNINIPCNSGDFVDIRFIERDSCNDDITLKKLECDLTGKSIQLPIEITSDSTATSYDQCIDSAKNTQSCNNINTVGGRFCSKYQWNKEECGTTTQVSETTSKYILIYEVTNQKCDFDPTNLQSNEGCLNSNYYPGPICEFATTIQPSSDTTQSSNDAIPLGHSTALMALAWLCLEV